MTKVIDITGNRFGRLKVISRAENAKNRDARWYCKCDCGKQKIIRGVDLRNGHTRSCGCIQREKVTKKQTTHGMTYTKTYGSWRSMIERCTNKNSKSWHRYGGRGITVCKKWLKFEGFLEDMGAAPDGLEIDRIDNNKGYYKKNCRWTTSKQNNRNKINNRILIFKGKSQCVADWANELGMLPRTLCSRLIILGWPVERALTQPVRSIKQRRRSLVAMTGDDAR